MHGFFTSKVVGVTFRNTNGASRQNIIKNQCYVGQFVDLIHELDNEKNKYAIKVKISDGPQIGYLPNDLVDKQAIEKGLFHYYGFISKVGFYKEKNIHYLQLRVGAFSLDEKQDDIIKLVEKELNNALHWCEIFNAD